MRLARHLLDHVGIVHDRRNDRAGRTELCQDTVVVAAALAEPITIGRDGKGGDEHGADRGERDARSRGLVDAHGRHLRRRAVEHPLELSVRYARQQHLESRIGQGYAQCARVGLGAIGGVARDSRGPGTSTSQASTRSAIAPGSGRCSDRRRARASLRARALTVDGPVSGVLTPTFS